MTFLTLLGGWVTGPKMWDLLTPNGGSFAHDIRPVTQSPSKKLNRNWLGPVRIQTVLDNTHYLCSDWSGRLIPKKIYINRHRTIL